MARFGRRKRGGETAVQPTQPAPGATQPPAGRAEPAAPGESPAPPTQPPAGSDTGAQPAVRTPEPTVAERLEGQRSWLAQLDRRVGVRTYAGAAALVLALAAAAVALVLVLQTREDVDTVRAQRATLEEQIAGVEESATEAAQEDLQSMTERVAGLETEISEFTSGQDATERQLSVIEDDIQDLRDEIADLDSDGGGGGGSP